MVHSRYDEGKVVWKGNLTQEDALAFSLDNQDETERDIMHGHTLATSIEFAHAIIAPYSG